MTTQTPPTEQTVATHNAARRATHAAYSSAVVEYNRRTSSPEEYGKLDGPTLAALNEAAHAARDAEIAALAAGLNGGLYAGLSEDLARNFPTAAEIAANRLESERNERRIAALAAQPED